MLVNTEPEQETRELAEYFQCAEIFLTETGLNLQLTKFIQTSMHTLQIMIILRKNLQKVSSAIRVAFIFPSME